MAKPYKNLSAQDIAALTNILSRAPHSAFHIGSREQRSYTQVIEKRINRLPSHLKRCSSSTTRIFMNGASSPSNSTYHLCDLHYHLHPEIVDSLFSFVKSDVEEGIPNFLWRLHAADKLSPGHAALLAPLRDIPAMWMLSHDYTDRYMQAVKAKWTMQADGCNACMLARIGSDSDAVLALRVGMVARMKESKSKPDADSVRMRWVTGWIETFDWYHGQVLIRKSQEEGMALKELMRGLKRDEYHARKQTRETTATVHELPADAELETTIEHARTERPAHVVSSAYSQNTGVIESQIIDFYLDPRAIADQPVPQPERQSFNATALEEYRALATENQRLDTENNLSEYGFPRSDKGTVNSSADYYSISPLESEDDSSDDGFQVSELGAASSSGDRTPRPRFIGENEELRFTFKKVSGGLEMDMRKSRRR